MAKENTKIQPDLREGLDELSDEKRYLTLHNDEVHTFDYVIDALIKVCDMDSVQAEQCTYLVHYKGRCDVKKGTYKFLKPFREALLAKELKATID